MRGSLLVLFAAGCAASAPSGTTGVTGTSGSGSSSSSTGGMPMSCQASTPAEILYAGYCPDLSSTVLCFFTQNPGF